MNSFKIIIYSIVIFLSSFLNSSEAHVYVDKVHKEIIEVIKFGQLNYSEKPEYFTSNIGKALEPLVDFDRISKNVMGVFYKEATEKQRNHFTLIFRDSLLDTYSKTLAEFKDEQIIILPPDQPSTRPGRDKVYLEIVTANKTYPGLYYMYLNKEGSWKIINIIINGVNLGLTFRNQFAALMKTNLNDYDEVIKAWKTSL